MDTSITILDPIEISKNRALLEKLAEYGLNHLEPIANTGWNYALDQVWIVQQIENYLMRYSPEEPIILDVGCGKSIFHNFVEEHFGINVIGVDRPSGFCNPGEFWNVDYFVDFLELAAFEEETIDIIFWLSSIEHNKLPQIRDLYQKSMSLLKTNGLFLATVPLSERTVWFAASEQTNLSIDDCKRIFGAPLVNNDFCQMRKRYKENVLFLKDRYQARYGHFSEDDPQFIVGGVKAVKVSPKGGVTSTVTSSSPIKPSSRKSTYNVLFYIEPMATFHRPLFHLPWWTFAYRKMQSLDNDPFRNYSFRVITSKAIKENIPEWSLNSDIQILDVDSEMLLTHFGRDYLKASLAWYHGTFTQEQISFSASLIKKTLNHWQPDLIISYSPAPFLQKAYPQALTLYSEYGMTSRPPFPESFYFDPFGYYKYSYLRRYTDLIDATQFTEQDYEALKEYRDFFISLIEQQNPFKPIIENLRHRFSHLILVPLQASQNYWFDGNCEFVSQIDMIEHILKETPQNIGVIFVPHPDFPVFTSDTLKYLRGCYPHFIYSEEFEEFGSASQYLIRHVDAVASVSSMVGLQALIWQKKLIALGDSQLNFVADATSLDSINQLIENKTNDKDSILLWLLSRYYVPLSYIQDSIWFGDFLERSLVSYRSQEDSRNFYRPIDHIPKLVENIIKNANLNIPVVKENSIRRSIYSAREIPRSYILSLIDWAVQCIANGQFRNAKEALVEVFKMDPNNEVAQTLIDYLSQISYKNPNLLLTSDHPLVAWNLDAPSNGEKVCGILNMYGWMISQRNAEPWDIRFLIDRMDLSLPVERGPREDVLRNFELFRQDNPAPGFGTKLDTNKLVDGEHLLTVLVENKTTVEQIAKVRFYVSNHSEPNLARTNHG